MAEDPMRLEEKCVLVLKRHKRRLVGGGCKWKKEGRDRPISKASVTEYVSQRLKEE